MMDPKMRTVEYVSNIGHQVDINGNAFNESGVFITTLVKQSLMEISKGYWAGFNWTPVNVIVANE